MQLNIPQFTAIRYMVFELGKPFRGFATKAEAEAFASLDPAFEVKYIPKTYKSIEVEESPF